MTFPTGTVTTKAPNRTTAYGFPWTQVSRWEPLYSQAGDEFGVAPLLLAAFSIIESNANHYTTGKRTGTRAEVIERTSDAFDRVPAVGMMQIKLGYHADKLPDADGYTPEGNLRLGAKLLAGWIRELGSLEKALTERYFPGDDAGSGITQREYIRAVRDLITEVKASWTQPKPAAVTFGRVPKPAWQDRQIPDARNWAWNALGQRTVRGVVYHRMIGTLWGTDGWFRGGGGGAGLTDFGIDNTTGEILQWNDHLGRGRAGISANRAPWASGPWNNPPGDGRAFVAKYGVNAINRDLVSLELAGNYDSPLSEAAISKIVALSAYLADQAKVPWTNYPMNPATGLVFTYWHNEFAGLSYKACPGSVVMSATPAIIERTKAVLKKHQVAA